MVGASVATSPIRGVIRPMRERGKIMNDVANTVGIMAPPMKPCTNRQTIISLIDVDNPHIRLATVKPAAETEKRIRVPNAREESRKRDHHHFGDQIGGLHPGDFVAAGGKS